MLGVYTGTSVSALTEVKSDDDSGGSQTSKLTFSAVSGTTYRIAVYGYNGKTGSFTLNWSLASTPETYTITYKPGANGTGSQQTEPKTYGVALTLKGAIFTRTGYTQTGWATSDGGSKAYNLSASYTSNAALTLYPFWTANTYAIIYDSDGGTDGADNPASGTYDTAFSVSSPTKDGYSFAGWTVTEGLDPSTAKWGPSSSPATAIPDSSTRCFNGESGEIWFVNLSSTDGGSVTLTANWEAVELAGDTDVGFYFGRQGWGGRAAILVPDRQEGEDWFSETPTFRFDAGNTPHIWPAIANFGETDLQNVPLRISVLDVNGFFVAEAFFSALSNALSPGYYNAGAVYTVVSMTGLEPGNYSLLAELDPENTLGDVDHRDNSATFPFVILPTNSISIPESLGCANVEFATQGDENTPFGQDFSGTPCVQFGPQNHSSTNSLFTKVSGPGALSFQWKTSCEAVYDQIAFFVDDCISSSLSGLSADWESVKITLPSGMHELRWSYMKDGSVDGGFDTAFLANLSWTPDIGATATSTTPEPVPHKWFDTRHPSLLAANGGDYEAAGNAMAANGVNKVWQCYVAGIDPEDEDAKFEATITMGADGKPVVAHDPPLTEEEAAKRTYRTLGKKTLDPAEDWTDVTDESDLDAAGWRFFKVKVEMK